jgi:hypothetical protein
MIWRNRMKYIVSVRTKRPVEFELVEFEAENEDELKEKILEKLAECLSEVDLIISQEVLEE